MQRSFGDTVFSFLVGRTLTSVANVVVIVPEGTLHLSGTILLCLDESEYRQVLVELDGQEVLNLRSDREMIIRGDYDDLIARHVESLNVQHVRLPDSVTSVVEFSTPDGKIVGAEIHLKHGSFSLTMYPEDVEVRPAGGAWDFVRDYGLPQLQELIIRQVMESHAG